MWPPASARRWKTRRKTSVCMALVEYSIRVKEHPATARLTYTQNGRKLSFSPRLLLSRCGRKRTRFLILLRISELIVTGRFF